VADGEINQRELDVLSQSFYEPITEELRQKHLEILSSSEEENKQGLNCCIEELVLNTSEEVTILFELLFKIIYADGYYDDREKTLIEYIVRRKGIKREQIAKIENDVVANLEPFHYKLPWAENLKSIVHRLISALRGEDGEGVELLSGAKFIEQVRNIAKWAEEDICFAENEVKNYNRELQDRIEKMEYIISQVKLNHAKNDEAKGLVNNLLHLNQGIMSDITDSLHENLTILNKKKRTITYFTIAFMGRTKAGKSTFHKVVTHEQDDDIGIGRQRTTRHNRSWYWESLRIIDTPGIGAAGEGGRTDEEVAKSIIDEADLVCYIVTNDSIQETEFDFLKGLKEKNKPLFIVLNVKYNLDNAARLKLFLKDPLKWKNDRGPKCIDGHIQRIKDCIGNKYDINNIEIIPVQLLAAKLYYSDNSAFSKDQRDKLFVGSNIKEFITSVKKCVYDTGNIKKTQNIVDGCGTQIHSVSKIFSKEHVRIKTSYERVNHAKKDILDFIKKESSRVVDKAMKYIDNAHAKMEYNAAQFAELHYEDKRNLGDLWKNDKRNRIIYDEMNANVDKLTSDFVLSVNNRMEEIMSDVEFLFSFQAKDEDIKGGGKTSNTRLYFNIMVGAMTTIATFFTPIGWGTLLITVAGLIFSGISNLFKSKEQKKKEKRDKLISELKKSIGENRTKIKTQFQTDFAKYITDVSRTVDVNFSLILNNAKDLMIQLMYVINSSEQSEEMLNKFFVYRIFQHIHREEIASRFDNSNFETVLSSIKVERDYEQQSIHIISDLFSPQDEDVISKLTQSKVTIN
jgi:GTP-binding protein EngB required for normal cell division